MKIIYKDNGKKEFVFDQEEMCDDFSITLKVVILTVGGSALIFGILRLIAYFAGF